MFDVEKGEIYLYDEIGPGWLGMIDDIMVVNALNQMGGKDVTARINSPGGGMDVGFSIYNALKRYEGKVTTVNDGLAASAGSYILLAGDEVLAAENSVTMIHKPWTIAMGDKALFAKTIDVLDTYEKAMISMYVNKTGKPQDEVMAAIDAETWYTASEAIEFGLVDAIDVTAPEVDEVAARSPEGQAVAAKAVSFRETAAMFPIREGLKLNIKSGAYRMPSRA